MPPKLFPLAIVALNLGAASVYLANRDYKHALYWFCSAVIIGTVTF